MKIFVQIPFFWGQAFKEGVLERNFFFLREDFLHN
jgi:hypothetical protein